MSLTDGLLAFWQMSNGSGTSASDATGNNRTLTLVNTPTWVTGRIGGGSDFESSSTQGANRANEAWMRPGAGNWSVAFWVKRESAGVNDYPSVLSCRPWNALRDNGWVVGIGGAQIPGLVCTHFADGSTGWDISHHITAATAVSNGLWSYWVVVFDRTNGKVRFYMDGVLDTERTPAAFPSGSVSTTSDLLMADDNLGRRFDGTLDEVGIWNRVLTAAEVAELYNSGAGLAYPFTGGTLVFDLPCQDDAGSIVVVNNIGGGSQNGFLSSANSDALLTEGPGAEAETELLKALDLYNDADAQYISLAVDSPMSFERGGNGLGEYTLEIWFKAYHPGISENQLSTLFAGSSVFSVATGLYVRYLDPSNAPELIFICDSDDDTSGTATSPTLDFDITEWNHIVAVLRLSDGECDYYVNGVSVAADVPFIGSASGLFAHVAQIGFDNDVVMSYGKVAGPKMYGEARTAEQILASYQEVFPAPDFVAPLQYNSLSMGIGLDL